MTIHAPPTMSVSVLTPAGITRFGEASPLAAPSAIRSSASVAAPDAGESFHVGTDWDATPPVGVGLDDRAAFNPAAGFVTGSMREAALGFGVGVGVTFGLCGAVGGGAGTAGLLTVIFLVAAGAVCFVVAGGAAAFVTGGAAAFVTGGAADFESG